MNPQAIPGVQKIQGVVHQGAIPVVDLQIAVPTATRTK